MKDYILRATAADGMVRAFFADTRETVDRAAGIHQTSAVVSAALGRLMTAGLMMGAMLKEDDGLVTLSVKGDGPVGGLLVTADNHGVVKGYAENPQADVPNHDSGKLNVAGVVGSGRLTVVKDMGFGETYNGTVALQSGEIAEDVAYYFAQSEQVPSVVALGVLVDTDLTIKRAGGFIIQLMPGADEHIIAHIEDKMTHFSSVTTMMEAGHTPETLLAYFFDTLGYDVLDTMPVQCHCNCSRDRIAGALRSIGADALEEMADEDKGAEVQCHFCLKQYQFSEDELRQIVADLNEFGA